MKHLLSNTVQESRKKHQLTQAELADIVSVTRQTIISIEKGNYVPSVALALKIAKALNTEVEELFILTN
ncbi:helix-turn-helix transcriptional regulator [Candidatus Kaiserbacteria bacterium]|nr:helix-turn-helix transcriptional regulator [Candidatus Kaiserbacteria bacterium]MCB9817860.1 helix-turn-helix transcriptional regulator [Candidatus Nomurabacteria bacterium]